MAAIDVTGLTLANMAWIVVGDTVDVYDTGVTFFVAGGATIFFTGVVCCGVVLLTTDAFDACDVCGGFLVAAVVMAAILWAGIEQFSCCG